MLLKTLNKKKVSSICLGTWALGGNNKKQQAYGKLKEKPENILKYSFRKKINFFDTANVYGNSENILGMYLIKKEKVFLLHQKSGVLHLIKN